MADSLTTAMKNLRTARLAVAAEMKRRFPVGNSVTWRSGNGDSAGTVVGHPCEWSDRPHLVQVENQRTGRRRWVHPHEAKEPTNG